MEPVLADEGVSAAFARDGVVCVRSVLNPAEVAVAAAAIETVLASPGPLAQVASRLVTRVLSPRISAAGMRCQRSGNWHGIRGFPPSPPR
jgi:hypothetical protein